MGRGSRTTANAHTTAAPRGRVAHLGLEQTRLLVSANAPRIAEAGNWPPYIDAQASLTGRVPTADEQNAPGFDAGIAAALDLVPRDKQKLIATLHAAYTPEAVAQVRAEAAEMDPDAETTWWLAACSVCEEGAVDAEQFLAQIESFSALAADPAARQQAAREELAAMKQRYEIRDDVAFATADGGMQGAYCQGHAFSAMYAEDADLYFIGTYEESLGLEDFEWSDEVDEQGRARSGGVHGSMQFMKAANEDEYNRAIAVVKAHFADRS